MTKEAVRKINRARYLPCTSRGRITMFGIKLTHQNMSLFKAPRGESPSLPDPENPITVTVFNLSKRYDLYCSTPSEDRLYEDMKIIGIRTFEHKKNQYAKALIGGYLEIESPDGKRMMIPHLRIYMICEHGSQPAYKVIRVRKTDGD